MSPRPYVLWLIWQNSETRQRYHVGNLVHWDNKYIFSYEKSQNRRTLHEAVQNGYKPHLAFRNIDKVYVSDRLFGPFARRLPDRRRPDYWNIIEEHGLSRDFTDMDLLRATGGRLATDCYEFVAPIHIDQNQFYFDFHIAGWRYYDGEMIIDKLKPGEKVKFVPEPANPEDTKAVIVLTNDFGHKLGYIPAFYSGFMYEVISRNDYYEAKVESVHPRAKPQLKVSISVVGSIAHDYSNTLFSDIQPLQQLPLTVEV